MSGSEDKQNRKRHGSEAIDIPGASTKDDDDDERVSRTGVGSNLPPWVAGGSPARFISHDEILKMSHEMENLEMAHEIAIDPYYKIPDEPSDPIVKCAKESVHRAFYDLLNEDLHKDPPEYDNCIKLLMDMKAMLMNGILTEKHVRLRNEMNAILDEETLRTKLEADTRHVKVVMNFLITLLGGLCAPFRDSMVDDIKKCPDIIEQLKMSMKLIELMIKDLSNFQISVYRDAIGDFSANQEYQMFQKNLAKNPNGCDMTRKWLSNAYDELNADKSEKNEHAKKKLNDIESSDGVLIDTTSRGYVKLVHSENPDIYPETMNIDKSRVSALAEKFAQIVVCASAIFVTCNTAGQKVSEAEKFKEDLKNHLIAITNRTDERSIKIDLERIGEQCSKEAKECSQKINEEWDESKSVSIKNQINNLLSDNNPIRNLVVNRVSMFIEEMLRRPTSVPLRLLPGLSVVRPELCAFTARFLRLCVHNRKTFYELYQSIILELQVDKGDVVLDRTNCREASPGAPGPSTSG